MSHPSIWLTWLAMTTIVATPSLPGCGGPTEQTLSSGSLPRPAPTRHDAASDTRTQVTPLLFRDVVRLSYGIRDRDGHVLESGVLESGSWGAFAVVALVNDEARAPTGRLPSRLTAVANRQVRGADQTPLTRDDRPFRGLAELARRTSIDTFELGALLQAARHARPLPLPKDPAMWVVAEGAAFELSDEMRVLALVNHGDVAQLSVAGLRPQTLSALAERRPLVRLSEVADLPWLGRTALIRLNYLADGLAEVDPPVGAPTNLDAVEPGMRLLRAMYTPAHLAEVDGTLTDMVVAGATLAELRAAVDDRIEHPFEDVEPTQPTSARADELRACAAEHLVDTLVTSLGEEAPVPPYRELAVDRRDALTLDLRRLRDGAWEVWEQDGVWTVIGRVWGLLAEISFNLETLALDGVYIEFD